MGIGAGQAYLERDLLVSFSPAPLANVSPGVAAWGVFLCPFLFSHSPPRCRPPTHKELDLSSTLPLTSAQYGVWNAQKLNPESPYYVVGEVLHLGPGHIELETLQHSIAQLQQEAETLRVRVTTDGLTPQQSVVQEGPGVDRVIDVRHAADPQRSAEAWVDALRAECAETMRTMVDQPLCRYVIILLDVTETWVVQLYHHLIVDGFSASLLTRRLSQIYTARVAGKQARPFRAASLSELVALDQEYRESAEHTRDKQYWTSVLAQLPEVAERATMNTATKAEGTGQTTITTTMRLGPEIMEKATKAATDEQITWVELMIALYGAFVHRLLAPRSTSEQFLAVPVMARSHTRELRTPAMAVNVLPLRVNVDNQQTVQEYLHHAVESLHGLLAHQRLRGESLPQITGDSRVADVLHGVGVNAKAFTTRADFAGVPGRLRNVAGGPPEDLGLVLTPAEDGGLDMAFETDPARVSAEHARARLEALREFTCQALEDTSRKIGELPLHSQRRRVEMLEQRRAQGVEVAENSRSQDALSTALSTLRNHTQAHLVVHTADGWDTEPGTEMLDREILGAAVLNSKDLHAAVHRLASYFRREVLGSDRWRQAEQVTEQDRARPVLALEMERGRELALAVLAAFAAGVPFVYIDPTSPAQRREQIHANAEPVASVDAAAIRYALALGSTTSEENVVERSAESAACPDPEQLAYLIYTSGSTGKPKGVEVPRRAISSLFAQHRSGLYDRPHAVVAHTASFSFDAAFDQLLWLLAGHDVHLYPEQATGDADKLVEHFATQQINVVDTTPSMMKALLAAQLLEKVPSLQLVVLGGEELPAELWDHLAATGLEVVNAYGPTESTVDALLARVEPGVAHLGRPVAGMRAYLVDNALQLVGDQEVGELVLAGPQLALGYRGLPEATDAAFKEDVRIDPRRAPERIYRTGDRARWIPGRGYQFLGRADEQVEINGQRVELAEVEAVLASVNGVRHCAVAPLNRSGQATVLVAAVVGDWPMDASDLTAIRHQLQAALPAAAIPRRIHPVRALPTTTSGKIDREAIAGYGLQPPTAGAKEDTAAPEATEPVEVSSAGNATTSGKNDPLAPLDPAHLLLHRTVCDVLHLPPQQTDPDQDFISLGGESIAALHVASRARQQGLLLQPKDLMGGIALAQIPLDFRPPQNPQAPQVSQAARPTFLSSGEDLGKGGNSRSNNGDNQWLDWGVLPWSPVARTQIAAAPTVHAMRRHVMYRWLDMPPGCGQADVLRAVEVLQRRHASLRMLLDWDNVVQLIPRVPLANAEEIVVELAPDGPDPVEQLAAGIAPDGGVMWQVGLCREGALVMVHHLAIDALSWPNLQREWNAVLIDANVKLPALTGLLRAHGMQRAVEHQAVQNVPPGSAELSVLPELPEKLLCPRGQATMMWRNIAMPDAAAMSSELAQRFRTDRQVVVVSLLAQALQAVGLTELQLVVEGHGRDGGTGATRSGDYGSTGSAVDCMELIGWFTTEERWAFSARADGASVHSSANSPRFMAAWVRAGREAESQAQPWDPASCPPNRRVVINVLDAQPEESFGVLESDDRRMTEALTINVFLTSDGADVEYVADLAALRDASPTVLEKLHEQLQRAARDLLVADRLVLRQALPSDYRAFDTQPTNPRLGHSSTNQPTPTLSVAHLRSLEAAHGPLEDIVPATASQQGLLFHGLAGTDRYVIAAAVDLTGVASPELIHQSMRAILRRHAALRAVFDCSDLPLMLIPERLDLPWTIHDCRDFSPAAAHAFVEQLRELRGHRAVDLESGPLVTADLVLLPESNRLETNRPATLVLGSHHILTDGWSTAVMLQDLQRLLSGEDLDPAPSFAEFARSLCQRSVEQLEREHRAWQQIFTGTDQPHEASRTGEHGGVIAGLRPVASSKKSTTEAPEVPHVLHRDTDGRVATASASLGTTPSVLVQTAWLLTLAALHGGRRVTTGVTLSGRSAEQPRMASAVGMFITTLPLHVQLEPGHTLRHTVRQVADTMALISENQTTPLQEIETLVGSAPLFDTAVVYDHHAHFGAPSGPHTVETSESCLRIQGLRTSGRTHYPLTVVCPPGDVLEITLVHRPDVVERILPDAAARWFGTFLNALCDAATGRDLRLVELLPERGEFEEPADGQIEVDGHSEVEEADTCNTGNRELSEDNPVCAQVQAAMESLLGNPIGPEENFFTSGGDSLLAMRLMGVLRKQGMQLKIQDIVDAGTPAAIAERLGQGTGGAMKAKQPPKPQQSQRLQTAEHSQRRPVWCLHPIGGHGLAFAPLASLLADTEFDTRLIELPSPLPQVETLAELAELYTEQILAEQQEGPFTLVGYSFGGVVAENIAAALQRRGYEVRFLGILDAYPSGSSPSSGTHSLPPGTPDGRTAFGDYDVRAIARADGMSHELGTVGVDIESNIRFCMQLLHTAAPTSYEGRVELVVATQNNSDVAHGQWDPAAAWRRRPGAYPVRVSELELTHAQLVKADGWKNVFQQWAPRLLNKSSADWPAPEATGIDPAHATPPHADPAH